MKTNTTKTNTQPNANDNQGRQARAAAQIIKDAKTTTIVDNGKLSMITLARLSAHAMIAQGLTLDNWSGVAAGLLGLTGFSGLPRNVRRSLGIKDSARTIEMPKALASWLSDAAASKSTPRPATTKAESKKAGFVPTKAVAAPKAKKAAKAAKTSDGKIAIAVTTTGDLLVGQRAIDAAVDAGSKIAATERAWTNQIKTSRFAFKVGKSWAIGRMRDAVAADVDSCLPFSEAL